MSQLQSKPNKSPVNIVGTWRGHTFPDMPKSLRNTGLNDLLLGVKERIDFAPGNVQKMQNDCYKMLVRDTGLSRHKIHQLINFDGLPHELAELCRQAKLTTGIHGQSTQLDRLRSARIQNYWDSLKSGVLGFKSQIAFGYEKPFNLVLDYWTTFVQLLMTNQSTVPNTFDIKGCVVGSNTVPTDETQASIQTAIAAKAFDTYSIVGYQTTWLTGWLPADGCGGETTISSATDGTTFVIADRTIQGLLTGGSGGIATGAGVRAIVTGAGLDSAGEKATISSVTPGGGTTATIVLTSALSITPPTGAVFRVIWYEAALTFDDPTNPPEEAPCHTRFLIEDDGGFDKGNNGTVPVGIYTESAIALRIVPD